MNTAMADDLRALRESMGETSAGVIIDMGLWLGQYPWRGIPNSSLANLRGKMAELGIERGIASAYENVFWENGLDAYEKWAGELGGDERIEVWPVVRVGETARLEKVLDKWRPRGVRVVPNYHGYRLSDVAFGNVMRAVRERGLVVQVFQRLADERWHWMLKVPAVEQTELEYFTGMYEEQRILVSGLQPVGGLAARMRQSERLFVDVSRMRGPQFAVESLMKSVPTGQIVFGSMWPVQIIEATLWQVTTAKVDDDVKAAILRGNAGRMLAIAGR